MFIGKTAVGGQAFFQSDIAREQIVLHVADEDGNDPDTYRFAPMEALDLCRSLHEALGLPTIPAGAKLFL